MLKSFYTTQFKRDYKLQQKRHKDLNLPDNLIRALVKEELLPPKRLGGLADVGTVITGEK